MNAIQIKTERIKEKAILNLSGDITTFAEEAITSAVNSCIDDCSSIIMNFEAVEYINSAGIAILIGVVTELLKRGGKLYVVNLTPHYRKIFKMVGIDQYINICESMEQALQSD